MIYQKNLETLKLKYPYLYPGNNNILDIIIEPAKSGDLTAIVDGHYLHSKYNPVKEANKITESKDRADIFVLGGFGLGYQCNSILKKFPDALIIIFEPDKNLFFKTLEYIDFTKLINNNKIIFAIGLPAEIIKDFLIPSKVKKITYLPLTNRVKLNSELFESIENIIKLYISRLEINRNTLIKFGKLWVKNQSKNLPQMCYKKDISILFDKFTNIPGIIISAGPSMEEIIPYLKTLKNKFLILAVDTALKSLLEEDIEPDFVMSIDSQFWNARHLEGITCKKTVLIADSSIQPAAIRSFHDKTFFIQSTFPLGKYFEEYRESFPKIASGGSVSTNIWDFAQKLGVKDIFLAGLDLGFPGKITHYKNSYFEKQMLITSNKLNPLETQSFNYIYNGFPIKVVSNSGKKITSDKRMNIYKEWFKEKTALSSIKNTYNLSINGSKIDGIPYFSLEDLLKYPDKREYIDELLNNLNNREEHYFKDNIKEAANLFKRELDNIEDLSNSAVSICKQIEKNFFNKLDVTNLLDKLNIIDDKIVGFTQSQTLSFIIEPFIAQLSESEFNSPIDALKDSAELYKKINQISVLHKKYLEHSIKKLSD